MAFFMVPVLKLLNRNDKAIVFVMVMNTLQMHFAMTLFISSC